MPTQNDKFYLGHRERLKEKFLDDKLTEYEQLELLLSFAIPRRDVKPLSRKLIEQFGSVYYVIIAEYDDLIAVPGIGRSTAILIKLVCSLISISHVKKLTELPVFRDHATLEAHCRMKLAAKPTEEFHVMYLDANFRLLEHEEHSKGNIESSNVYVDKIMQKALNKRAKSLILLHNHPVTENMFSSQDIKLTEDIIAMLKPCGLKLYDHYVIAGGIMYSMRASGLLNKSERNNESI